MRNCTDLTDGQRLHVLLLPARGYGEPVPWQYDRIVSDSLPGTVYIDAHQTSIIGLLGVIGAFFTTDWLGRRPIALAAGATLCTSLLVIGIMSQLPNTTARATALISFMCLWSFAFNSGVAPVGECR